MHCKQLIERGVIDGKIYLEKMEEHLKGAVSDDDIDDEDVDGVGLSQSRASLIQTSFFSSHRDSKSGLTSNEAIYI